MHASVQCFLQGRSKLPFPQVGFWAAYETHGNVSSLRVSDLPALDPHNFTQTSFFFPCSSGRCRGGPNFECEPGYDGPMCFKCQPNRFYWMGTCKTACDEIEPRGLVTVVGITAVVCVWYIFYMMTSGS